MSKFPRSYFLFSTWGRKNSSEVSFDSSEVSFLPSVGIFSFLRGDLEIPTWGFGNSYVEIDSFCHPRIDMLRQASGYAPS